jgi:hypothetical protein
VRIDPRRLSWANTIMPFLCAETGQSTARLMPIAWRFALCNDELCFCRQLLFYKRNLWLYRCHQQRLCGDFVVIDMSSPDPQKRQVDVVDLKAGADLKEGGGGAGNQLSCAQAAVERLARRTGVLSARCEPRLLTGDRRLLIQALRKRA